MLFYEICTLIAENFKALEENFEMAFTNKSTDEFKKSVDIHNKIFESFKIIKSIYAPIILNKFLTFTMLICMLGFQILMVNIIENLNALKQL